MVGTRVTASDARSQEKRNGRIEFFSRGESLVMGYDLYTVGLVSISTAVSGQVKAEIYCSRMDVKAGAWPIAPVFLKSI